MTALAGKLPKGDRNGLSELTAQLVKNPTAQHVVLAVVDVGKIVNNVDTGDVEPTLRILRIESVLPEDMAVAELMIRRALQHRLGADQLPIELEQELDAIFEDFKVTEEPSEGEQPTLPIDPEPEDDVDEDGAS